MSTDVENGRASIVQFGETIANAIERLDEKFMLSFLGLRSDVQRLEGKFDELIEAVKNISGSQP